VGPWVVTNVARTLIDLAAISDEELLATALEGAWRRKLVDLNWIDRRLDRLGRKGRAGAEPLRRVLDDCRRRGRPLDSALEVRFWRWVKRSGLPRPAPGFDVWDDEGPPMRIDFAYPAQRLAVETDGLAVHGRPEVQERDRVRLSRLAALGWRVQHVTWSQLRNPERLQRRLANALAYDGARPENRVTVYDHQDGPESA
jgi:hypothetical protein